MRRITTTSTYTCDACGKTEKVIGKSPPPVWIPGLKLYIGDQFSGDALAYKDYCSPACASRVLNALLAHWVDNHTIASDFAALLDDVPDDPPA